MIVRSAVPGCATLFAISLVLGGCGYIGDPLPPALNIPSTVSDLRAVQYGNRIVVDFTIPPLTTEGLALRKLGRVELRAGTGGTPFIMNEWASTAKAIDVTAEEPGPVSKAFPSAEFLGRSLVIAVRVYNSKGRPSGWSNLKILVVGAPVAKPLNVTATNDIKGVQLSWQSGETSFRVFRKSEDEKRPVLLDKPAKPEYLDEKTMYGKHYDYIVQAVRGDAESEVSETKQFVPKDDFAPAVPAGLNILAGVNTVELAWDRNMEPDFRGYSVYRSVDGGAFEKSGDLLTVPSFSDKKVQSGKRYQYAVSAIDQTGNESARSTPVEITAP